MSNNLIRSPVLIAEDFTVLDDPEEFFTNGEKIRGIPVSIGGSSYKPPIPIEYIVKGKILNILNSKKKGYRYCN